MHRDRHDTASPSSARAELSRRQLLGRAGVAALTLTGLPAVMTACGDDAATTSSVAGGGSTGAATAPQASGTIDYYGWEGEDFQTAVKDFLDESGVQVKAEAMASIDDGIAKVKRGGGTDLLGWSAPSVPLAQSTDTLEAIDESKIPNLANLSSHFKGAFPAAGDEGKAQVYGPDGARLLVPTYFTAESISYDSEVLPEPPASYNDMFKPEFKGKVGLFNDAVTMGLLAAVALGLKPSSVPKDRIGDLSDFMKRVVDQAPSIAPTVGDCVTQLVSGDIVMALGGYPPMEIFAAAAGKDTIKTALEIREGAYPFVEGLCIAKGSDNLDAAHAYINALLEPEANAAASNSVGGSVVVEGAEEFLEPNVRDLVPYDDLDAFFQKSPFTLVFPVESDEYVTQTEWIAEWTTISA